MWGFLKVGSPGGCRGIERADGGSLFGLRFRI